MIYLVSFSIGEMTYARNCGSRYDAVLAMREANSNVTEDYYRNAIAGACDKLAKSGSNLYASRIMSNIVLTVIAP